MQREEVIKAILHDAKKKKNILDITLGVFALIMITCNFSEVRTAFINFVSATYFQIS